MLLAFPFLLLAITAPSHAQNGEAACEIEFGAPSYSQGECLEVGCCFWDDDQCWSAVGDGECGNDGGSGGNDDGSGDGDGGGGGSGQNGEAACETEFGAPSYSQGECLEVGCCFWDGDQCWSAVGDGECGSGGDGGGGGGGDGGGGDDGNNGGEPCLDSYSERLGVRELPVNAPSDYKALYCENSRESVLQSSTVWHF